MAQRNGNGSTGLEHIRADDTVSLYYRDVRSIPLLTREEEVELANRIERGEEAQERLREVDDELDADNRALLEREVQQGKAAFMELVQANYRLVISIAKKYPGQGVPLLDRVQEGNLGLMRAVEKFDHTKGYKFSTYATWWIRQAVKRTLADQGRTIRLPVHMRDRIRRLDKVSAKLEKELGREPTPEEIAEDVDLSLGQVQLALYAKQRPMSLEMPSGDDEDNRELGEFIEGEDLPDPAEEMDHTALSEEIDEVLSGLTSREERVIKMRYGLGSRREHTLKEVGQRFDLTRERIRQIEHHALRKLRHPRRSRRLRSYLN